MNHGDCVYSVCVQHMTNGEPPSGRRSDCSLVNRRIACDLASQRGWIAALQSEKYPPNTVPKCGKPKLTRLVHVQPQPNSTPNRSALSIPTHANEDSMLAHRRPFLADRPSGAEQSRALPLPTPFTNRRRNRRNHIPRQRRPSQPPLSRQSQWPSSSPLCPHAACTVPSPLPPAHPPPPLYALSYVSPART